MPRWPSLRRPHPAAITRAPRGVRLRNSPRTQSPRRQVGHANQVPSGLQQRRVARPRQCEAVGVISSASDKVVT